MVLSFRGLAKTCKKNPWGLVKYEVSAQKKHVFARFGCVFRVKNAAKPSENAYFVNKTAYFTILFVIFRDLGCFFLLPALPGRPGEAPGGPKCSKRSPRGAPNGAQERPRRGPRSRKTAPGAAKRRTEAKMEPQRPSNEPQEASGVRESTGKQLGAPRRNGKRPASARSARARASRENSLNLPPGPPDQGELEKFAAKPPDYGKRERFTAEPPDYGKRERFTAGPPDHEKTRELYRGTTRQTQHTTGHTVASTAF